MNIILFLLLLSNIHMSMFSMYDIKKFPYHDIIRSITEDGIDQEEARGKLEKLYSNKENVDSKLLNESKGPNDLCNYRTAAILSSHYCIHDSYFFADQLAILEFLLNKDNKEEFDYNKKTIIADLTQKKSELKTLEKGLRQMPFEVNPVEGGGSVLTSDDGDDIERSIDDKLSKIKKVEEIVENISVKREASIN